MHLRATGTTQLRPVAEGGEPVEIGDYVCSDRALYRVEQIAGDRILLEDCRDYELLDVGPRQLEELRRVEVSGGGSVDSEPAAEAEEH